MKRRYKALVGLGIALGAYALWPSNEPVEQKLEQKVQQVQVKERKTRPRINLQQLCDTINSNIIRKKLQKVVIEEKPEPPSCLGCKDLTEEVERIKKYDGEVETRKVCKMLHGDKTEWYLNGQKKSVTPYFCGEKHGTVRTWHKNGQREEECEYEHDKKEGWCRAWDDEGHREIEVHYRNNVRDGMTIGYWLFTDNIAYEVLWENGKPVGKSRSYSPEGDKYKERVFDDNGQIKETTYFYMNGGIRTRILWKGYEELGEFDYNKKGQLLLEFHYWTSKESPDGIHKPKKYVKYDENGNILHLIEEDINGVRTKEYRSDK